MRSCLSGAECQPKPSELRSLSTMSTQKAKCGSDFAYAYFCSFIFLCSFLMLNLFVAVIMDNFDYLTRDSSILGAHHLDEYIRAWADIDPTGIGKVNYKEVYKLLLNMEPPVGFGKKCPKVLAYRRLIRMNMPVADDGTVHFTTTLFALIRESLEIKPRSHDEHTDKADDELKETIKKIWPIQSTKKLNLVVPDRDELHGTLHKRRMTVGKIYAAQLILENYRLRKNIQLSGGDARPKSFFTRLMGVVQQNQRSSIVGPTIQDADPYTMDKPGSTKTSLSNSVIHNRLPMSMSHQAYLDRNDQCLSSIVLNMGGYGVNGKPVQSEQYLTSVNDKLPLKYRPVIRTAATTHPVDHKKRSIDENHFIQKSNQSSDSMLNTNSTRASINRSSKYGSRQGADKGTGCMAQYYDMPSMVNDIIDNWEADLSREIRRKPSRRTYDSSLF
jgi:hypothetical protein